MVGGGGGKGRSDETKVKSLKPPRNCRTGCKRGVLCFLSGLGAPVPLFYQTPRRHSTNIDITIDLSVDEFIKISRLPIENRRTPVPCGAPVPTPVVSVPRTL